MQDPVPLLFALEHDDAVHFSESETILAEEIPFVHRLDQIFSDFAGRNRVMVDGETKYSALRHLARVSTTKACMAIMRHHISDGFSLSRQATDAAFYAVMMSSGRMTEQQYLTDFKHRNTLQGKIRREIEKAGLPADLPPIVKALQTVFCDHSKHAHADPMSLANRVLRQADGGIVLSFYQTMDDALDFRYYFLGMAWVGGLCLKAFLGIQRDAFGEDVSSFLSRLDQFAADMISHRQAMGIFPTVSDGF